MTERLTVVSGCMFAGKTKEPEQILLDFRGEPFGSMPVFLARADDLVHVTAICTYSQDGKICGEEATRTQRLVNGQPAHYGDPVVLIGAQEAYAPRCPNHHLVPGKPPKT